MKIFLSYDDKQHESEVRRLVDDELLYNCNFNGASYELLLDDFTYIDDCDNLHGALLLTKILNKIDELNGNVYIA